MTIALFKLAVKDETYIERLEDALDASCATFEECNGNFASHTFYYRGLYRAWKGEWSNAVNDIDIAVDKSEDNFTKYFYLRAITWGVLQNYKQAIADVSVCLSINTNDA